MAETVTSASGPPAATPTTRVPRARLRSVGPARSSPSSEILVRPELVRSERARRGVVPPEAVPPEVVPPQRPRRKRVPDVNARTAAARRSDRASDRGDWCAIVVVETEHRAEFQVVGVHRDGPRRVLARSPSFRLPLSRALLPGRRIPGRGSPRRAHDMLVDRLVASGWRQVQTRGRWHDTAFVQSRPDPQRPPPPRVLIGCERDGRTARFCAEMLDRFGNGTPVGRSRPFPVSPWDFGLRQTTEARAAHEELLIELCSSGWASASQPCREWYAQVLQRP